MSIHRVRDLGPNLPDEEIAVACGRCFYCGSEVQGIAVYWRGATIAEPNIALHPKCARDLANHLAKDGVIADHVERGNGPLIGVDRSLRAEAR